MDFLLISTKLNLQMPLVKLHYVAKAVEAIAIGRDTIVTHHVGCDISMSSVYACFMQLSPLHTGTGTSFFDCSLKVFFCEISLDVRTFDNRRAIVRVLYCKIPVSLKLRMRKVSPAGFIVPETFFIFFSA